MDKISFYNISVPFEGYSLLYNTMSDSLIAFTNEEYSVIEPLLNNLAAFSEEYPLLYSEMKKAGFIIDNYDEKELVKFNNKLCVYENRSYHLTINPTLDCNLKCWYCSTEYAQAIHHGGMSQHIVNSLKKHIDYLVNKVRIPALHLDWFGGEPLMYYKEVMKPIASYAKEITTAQGVVLTQHVTTNATLLNENMKSEMQSLNFTSFQIPLDGNAEHHDTIKFTNTNKGTFDIVVQNLNLLPKIIPNVHITLRINYDKKTLFGITDVIPLISENTKKHIRVDFQKVWQINCTEKEIQQLAKVKKIFYENGLDSGYWAYKPHHYTRCYADKLHQYAINYDGRVFKCTAQDYGDDKVIGRLNDDGTIKWNNYLLSELFAHSTFDNERCLNCKALPICMGPCIIRNFEARKSGRPIPCVFDNVQYSLQSFIIENAQKRHLIK